MDPPDARGETAAASFQHAGAQPAGTKQGRAFEPSLTDFYVIGKDLQNRTSHRVGSELSKDGRFHAFFGCGAHIALLLWQLLVSHALLPDESQILHLLWALFFMHVYPSEKVACSTVGGSNGAIDPKTLRKYI